MKCLIKKIVEVEIERRFFELRKIILTLETPYGEITKEYYPHKSYCVPVVGEYYDTYIHDTVDRFHRRLSNIGIETKFVGNYPWIYLDSVNGKKVNELYYSAHGFTAFTLSMKRIQPSKFTNRRKVFQKIREML